MSQDEINNDLGHYLHERKKTNSFWSRLKMKNQAHEAKKEMEKVEMDENISPEDKKELENMEQRIEEVNKVEEEVEETIEKEHEGLLTKFFKKLRSVKSDDDEEVVEVSGEEAVESNEEIRHFLKRMHHWITQLPPEKQQEFKRSEDFKLYTDMLKKHNLIKE